MAEASERNGRVWQEKEQDDTERCTDSTDNEEFVSP